MCCPKCRSRELHSQHKGFSGGKALAGAVLTGGIGLLAGTIGSKDVQITCLKCGNKFKAGEALILRNVDSAAEQKLDNELAEIIRTQGNVHAVVHYHKATNAGLDEAKRYVDNLRVARGIETAQQDISSGPMILVVLIVMAISVIIMVTCL